MSIPTLAELIENEEGSVRKALEVANQNISKRSTAVMSTKRLLENECDVISVCN
jgi:hypothetical protein